MLPETVNERGHVPRDAGAHDAGVHGADTEVRAALSLATGEGERKEQEGVLAVRVAEQGAWEAAPCWCSHKEPFLHAP